MEMDPYAVGWPAQGHGVGSVTDRGVAGSGNGGNMSDGANTIPRCWSRPCRSTDPSPMRPIEHSMRSTEAMRSMESMRSIDSVIRQPSADPMRATVDHHQSSRSLEGMARPMEQQIRTEQPRSSVEHPAPSSSMSSTPMRAAGVEHHALRAIEHPCRLKDHASYIHDHHFGARMHDHGCRSVEHVSRMLEHRFHEQQHPGRPPIEQPPCRPIEHPPVRPPPVNYSCRPLDHAPGRPMPMDCVIYGPHSHPPPRLPSESPFRVNCPVHSPFRYRFPNGAVDYHSQHQVSPQSLSPSGDGCIRLSLEIGILESSFFQWLTKC